MNTVVPEKSSFEPAGVMEVIPHTVREFGVEARKAGKSWEAAFNGPIQSFDDAQTDQPTYAVTVRLSRMKDPVSRELYSTNLLFYLPGDAMTGMHNVYDMAREFAFTRIRGPRTPAPLCPPRLGKLWYDANPEGVIMEDLRLTPATLPDGRAGFFVTGQGYRGKVVLPSGLFIHDVGVYGGYLDPQERPGQLELQHLFGGIEFVTAAEQGDSMERLFLQELGEGVWAKGIVGNATDELHVESYKNSVRLPSFNGQTLIGARSMSETKLLPYFASASSDGLQGYGMHGFIDRLPHAIGLETWKRVNRVGLGSNFIECLELDGFIGLIHVVLEKNNPAFPETLDPAYPDIEEQYEGWMVWLKFENGKPVIKACVRAITPDDVPRCYQGAGELFDTKRVAFPISLYHTGDRLEAGYGWGDRALFQAVFDYATVLGCLQNN